MALKRLASFGAQEGGGIGARFFPTGARVGLGHFLCIGWPAHGNKKRVLENHFLVPNVHYLVQIWCWKSILGVRKF